MTVITMSRTEIDRMSVLHDLADGRIKVAGASALMGVGRRQVFRLAKAYDKHGPQALVSRQGRRDKQQSQRGFHAFLPRLSFLPTGVRVGGDNVLSIVG